MNMNNNYYRNNIERKNIGLNNKFKNNEPILYKNMQNMNRNYKPPKSYKKKAKEDSDDEDEDDDIIKKYPITKIHDINKLSEYKKKMFNMPRKF